MTKISRELKYLVILPVYALFFFIGAVTVQAATYYVATTGSDSNPGTSGAPFLTIQKCINTVAAGGTCTVADGTYTDHNGNAVVGYARSPNAQGSATAPITIKSTNPNGAKVIVPSVTNVSNTGFYIALPYWIIEGFEIKGGAATGANVAHHGIIFTANATGGVARKNTFHHIGRTVCSNSAFGFDAIFTNASAVTIEENQIYSIGRLKNGESGCSTSIYHHDHGIYVKGGANVVIRRNAIYDTNRGWPIHVYGGTVTNLSVYNNTLSGHNTTTSIPGQIILGTNITTANIKNNISYDATIGLITYASDLVASGITISFNLSDKLEKTGTHASVTFSNNIQNTSPGFVNAAGNDFHLTSVSAAINAGTNVGYPFNGTTPDIGMYEFGASTTGTSTTPLVPPQNVRIQ